MKQCLLILNLCIAALFVPCKAGAQIVKQIEQNGFLELPEQTYSVQSLNLHGPVKRVVEYDSTTNFPLPVLDSLWGLYSAGTYTPSLESSYPMHLDSTVWEFDKNGNVLKEIKSGRQRTFHRNAKGLIDSIGRLSPNELYRYELNHYDPAGRLIEHREGVAVPMTGSKGIAQTKNIEASRDVIKRKKNGDIDSIITILPPENRRPPDPIPPYPFYIVAFDIDKSLYPWYSAPISQPSNRLHAAKLIRSTETDRVVLDYFTDAAGQLRIEKEEGYSKDSNEKEYRYTSDYNTIYDTMGRVLYARQLYPSSSAEYLYTYEEYGNRLECNESDSRQYETLPNKTIESSTKVVYHYTYDSYGNWTSYTTTQELDNVTYVKEPESYLLHERHIEYW